MCLIETTSTSSAVVTLCSGHSEFEYWCFDIQVASSATIAGLAAESPNPNASLFLSDTVQGLVNVFHNSESSREKITILETLAILMEISEESIASHIVNANGEEALTEILGRGMFFCS